MAASISDDLRPLLEQIRDSEVDSKGLVPDELRTNVFRKLRVQQSNRTCFDCPARNPTWISLNHGCYVCLECSGEHRRFGVHISFVRSVELDGFTKDQLSMMICGGNSKAKQFFKGCGIDGKRKDSGFGGKSVDYFDKNALRYRKQLEKDTADLCKEVGIEAKGSAGTVTQPQGSGAVVEGGAVDLFGGKSTSKERADKAAGRGDLFSTPADTGENFFASVMNTNATPLVESAAADKSSSGGEETSSTSKPAAFNPFASPDFVAPKADNNNGHFASSSGKQVKAKAKKLDDDDFDFAAFEKEAKREVVISQPTPVGGSAMTTGSGVAGGYGMPNESCSGKPAPMKTYGLPDTGNAARNDGWGEETDETQANSKKAKNLDDEWAPPVSAEHAAKFSNQQAFGSDQFFGREEQRSSTAHLDFSSDLEDYKERALEWWEFGIEAVNDLRQKYVNPS